MSNFWVQQERWAVRDTECITFGDLVKPFGRKYKGMWRVFGISENGEIMLVSDDCIGAVRLIGSEGYRTGTEKLDQLCINTVKSSKAASVRSMNSFDLTRLDKYRKELLEKLLYEKDCWLAADYVMSGALYYEAGLEAICNGTRTKIPLEEFYRSKMISNRIFGVRAIVTLRKNVEFHKIKRGYWKI